MFALGLTFNKLGIPSKFNAMPSSRSYIFPAETCLN